MTNYITAFPQSGSCKLGENWSTCFLRVVAKQPETDCSVLFSDSCKAPAPGAGNQDAQAYYGAYTIWSTWSYLNSWAVAISDLTENDFDIIKDHAQPAGTDEFVAENAGSGGIQNIDTALGNMIHMLNKAQEPADAALLALMKGHPSPLTYHAARSTGLDVGNLLQQRLADLMARISSDVPAFLELVDGGQFSRRLNYNAQTIGDVFVPKGASSASITDGAVSGGRDVVGE